MAKPISFEARIEHAERTKAQPEAIQFFNAIGRAEKHRDGVSTVCHRCGANVVAIPHTDVGVADYIGYMRTPFHPIAFACEVKAGGLVFPMSRIAPEQWDWLQTWEDDMGTTAWFWIMVGTQAVNAVTPDKQPHPFRRVTYLVTVTEVGFTARNLIDITGGKQTTLPASRTVPHIRFGKAYDAANMFADEQWHKYRMEWTPNVGWWPHRDHPWWSTYGIEYRSPEIIEVKEA